MTRWDMQARANLSNGGIVQARAHRMEESHPPVLRPLTIHVFENLTPDEIGI